MKHGSLSNEGSTDVSSASKFSEIDSLNGRYARTTAAMSVLRSLVLSLPHHFQKDRVTSMRLRQAARPSRAANESVMGTSVLPSDLALAMTASKS